MDQGKNHRSVLSIVFLTVFLDMVGFGILIPIQPFYAQELGASPAVTTLLGASFSLMQFLFGSFWGRLSDKHGRRPIMLVSIALTALGYLLFGFSHSLPVLFFARMISGLGSANIGTAQAIIADSTGKEGRAKGMGLIGAAFGLGFIFGPVLGGMFVKFGLQVPALLAAGLSALNWLIAVIRLPETNPVKLGIANEAPSAVRQFSLAALKHAARHANVPQLFAVYFVFSASFSMMEQILGLYIQKFWGHLAIPGQHDTYSASLTSYVLIVVGVTATIVQGGLIGKLVRRFGEKRLLVAGPCLVACGFVCVPISGWLGAYSGMLLTGLLMAVGTGLSHPTMASLLSQSVDVDERGGSLGLGQSLAALGRVFGPAVSGLFFQIFPGMPFLVGAAGLVVVSILVHTKLRPAAAEGS